MFLGLRFIWSLLLVLCLAGCASGCKDAECYKNWINHYFHRNNARDETHVTAASLKKARHAENATLALDQLEQKYSYNAGQAVDLNQLKNSNEPYDYLKLGQAYLVGNGVKKDFREALIWYKKAAIAGIAEAKFTLGNMYQYGLGVPVDLDTATTWYLAAAKTGYVKAMIALGEIYSKSVLNQARYWYQQACELGSKEAELKLAVLEGRTTRDIMRENQIRAEGLYAKALSYTAKGAKQDYKQAFNYFLEAANLNLAAAQYAVGEAYREGKGVERNYEHAREFYLKAAAQKFALAEVRLADLAFSGFGAPRYLPEAIKWYAAAAAHGNVYAQYMQSIMYERGIHTKVDLKASMDWYNKANQNKDAVFGLMQVARNYATGYGFAKDLAEAIRWMRRAALHTSQAAVIAQAGLGDLYSRNGDTMDLKEACKFYHKAALSGYSYAQYAYAINLLHGRGVDFDKAEGLFWLKKSAYQGYRPAQNYLGHLYFDGDLVNKNDIRAYAWWSLALGNDYDASSPQEVHELIHRMEPDSKQKALELAQRYGKRYKTAADPVFYEK